MKSADSDDRDDRKHDIEINGNAQSRVRPRTYSNASNGSVASEESDTRSLSSMAHRPIIRLTTLRNVPSQSEWSISMNIKMKYDQLYDDLLRQEVDRNNMNQSHHNPFGLPMVSNQTMYRYLTSVGYSPKLIKLLWKVINTSNTNHLLTRNGFVAICHMLDKLTNDADKYSIPSTLPLPLQPSSLDKLVSTPVHNARLNSTVFPDINEMANNHQNGNDNELDLNDVFGDDDDSKHDLLDLTGSMTQNLLSQHHQNHDDGLLLIESPPLQDTESDLHPNSLDFMNVRGKTTPNTPTRPSQDGGFLSAFQLGMNKSRSAETADSDRNLTRCKSASDLFEENHVNHGNQLHIPYGAVSERVRGSNLRHGSGIGNDLDDLWKDSWKSSLNNKNGSK